MHVASALVAVVVELQTHVGFGLCHVGERGVAHALELTECEGLVPDAEFVDLCTEGHVFVAAQHEAWDRGQGGGAEGFLADVAPVAVEEHVALSEDDGVVVPLLRNDEAVGREGLAALALHLHGPGGGGGEEECVLGVAHGVAVSVEVGGPHPPVDGEGLLRGGEGHFGEGDACLVVAEVEAVVALGVAHDEGTSLGEGVAAYLVGGGE